MTIVAAGVYCRTVSNKCSSLLLKGGSLPSMTDIAIAADVLGVPAGALFCFVYEFHGGDLQESAQVGENDDGDGAVTGEVAAH